MQSDCKEERRGGGPLRLERGRRTRAWCMGIAWFVFFAPYNNPQIAGVVIVEKAGHGGAVAAPITRRIVSQYFGIRDRGVSYWRRLPELRRRGLVPKEPS